MGYNTYHNLTTKHATKKQDKKLLQMFIDGTDEYNKDWDWTVAEFNGVDIGESSKWYDCEKDMKELSSREEYKDILFILEGEGEDSDDVWTAYFKNGQMRKIYIEMKMPEFDENTFDIKEPQ